MAADSDTSNTDSEIASVSVYEPARSSPAASDQDLCAGREPQPEAAPAPARAPGRADNVGDLAMADRAPATAVRTRIIHTDQLPIMPSLSAVLKRKKSASKAHSDYRDQEKTPVPPIPKNIASSIDPLKSLPNIPISDGTLDHDFGAPGTSSAERITPEADDAQIIHRSYTPKRPSSPLSHKSNHTAKAATAESEGETTGTALDLSRRGIHIPTRTSSHHRPMASRRHTPKRETSRAPTDSSARTTPEHQDRSSNDSNLTEDTVATSVNSLPPLQTKGPPENIVALDPLAEDDPGSFNLLAPQETTRPAYSLESRSDDLFSQRHLETIFEDPTLLLRFTTYLSSHRPQSVPLLIYYLDALKSVRAISYANAVAEALEPIPGHDFTEHPARSTVNSVLEEKTKLAFEALVRNELPAYITHVFTQVASATVQQRVTGTLPPHLRETSEGLAEVFCMSDPSRPDNPLIFASEEFHRMTQYGVSYAMGRNCRFLQGPRTNRHSIARLKAAVVAGKETSEVFLNYRRDGSPFMNLLMIAPLHDSRGVLRYFIGAQCDVSGLVKDCNGLDGLQRMLAKREAIENGEYVEEESKDEFQELTEMYNTSELDIVRKHGGRMHREQEEDTVENALGTRPRLLLKDPSNERYKAKRSESNANLRGRLQGVYQHYLLVRPYPSLRIIFTSPSLRVPGILQSHFLSRISGSARVTSELDAALASGRGVTAKIRWRSSRAANPNNGSGGVELDEEGRPRWIHCTPLFGANGAVGVWMIVLVDEESAPPPAPRRFRAAPPVAMHIASNSVSSSGSNSNNNYAPKRSEERDRHSLQQQYQQPPKPQPQVNLEEFQPKEKEKSSSSRPRTPHGLRSRPRHTAIHIPSARNMTPISLLGGKGKNRDTGANHINLVSDSDDAAPNPVIPTTPTGSTRGSHHRKNESAATAILDARSNGEGSGRGSGRASLETVGL